VEVRQEAAAELERLTARVAGRSREFRVSS